MRELLVALQPSWRNRLPACLQPQRLCVLPCADRAALPTVCPPAQVSQVAPSARAAVAAAGGSVTTVYYNQLGLRALLKPDWFAAKGRLLPRPARPPPKLEAQFDVVGELPPRTELPAAAA